MHRFDPDDADELPSESETPMSDALVVPMLQAVERELARLERAPIRRRPSPRRQLERARAIHSLVRRFEWLMLRYQDIRDRPPPEQTYAERAKALQELEDRIGELVAEHCGHPK